MSEELFRNLLKRAEKLLIPLGVWPSENNYWITVFNIVILLVYSILVLIKNLLNPEGESVENAFTLANGGLITVVYFVTMLVKKDQCAELYAYIKTENQLTMTGDEKKVVIDVGREFYKITTAFLYFLPTAVLIRFLLPTVEFTYLKLVETNKTFELPPAMGLPVEILGEIPTYILESFVRAHMLSTLMGVCSAFILSTLTICTQFNILALRFEQLKTEDVTIVNGMIKEHKKLLRKDFNLYILENFNFFSYRLAKLLNDVFAPYFFSDCCFSFINLSIMMFSLIAHNARIQNFLSEMPLVTCGMSQLFFVLYFGDRLLDATGSLSTAAYKSEWYGKSIKHQKKILNVIQRAQRPQMLNVGDGLMIASMLLFSQICQKAYGAFNILRTTVQR